MSATATRVLVLGAVAMFAPVNGYQIRRELVSWQVDRWAHVNPGSVYHGLRVLTSQGLLARSDLVDGTRDVAVYEVTAEGHRVLDQLLVDALEQVDPYDRASFQVAFGLLPLVPREQVLRSLTTRRVALDRAVADFARERQGPRSGPPHTRRARGLWRELLAAELAWLGEVIEDIGSGTLTFAPREDWGWVPPAGDPGHQLAADRDRYRALLRRTP